MKPGIEVGIIHTEVLYGSPRILDDEDGSKEETGEPAELVRPAA